jgi:hypothetical protein
MLKTLIIALALVGLIDAFTSSTATPTTARPVIVACHQSGC